MSSSKVAYLSLDPQIEKAIIEQRKQGKKSPWATKDSQVCRREDKPHDEASLLRPAFARDIEKILNVPAYNRYAGKTQVFSLVEDDDICRRGLHVQLVGRIARNIGELLGLNCYLIEAIALGHDVGHTPFGHAGERFLSKVYHRYTGRYFNHNVHSVRVLDQLYRRNISLQTLDGVLCHNGEFACQELKMGTCQSFKELDEKIEALNKDESLIENLRPSTLEGCVVRVSDMIAYIGKDRQDALDRGVLSSLDIFESDYLGVENAQFINNLTVDIVNHSFGQDHISMSEAAFSDLKRAKKQNYELIYDNEGISKDAGNIIEAMFARMYESLYEDVLRHDKNSPVYLHHIAKLCAKSRSIDAQSYWDEDPHQVVVDYLASMTDNYFMALYDHLFPHDTNSLAVRHYCTDLK